MTLTLPLFFQHLETTYLIINYLSTASTYLSIYLKSPMHAQVWYIKAKRRGGISSDEMAAVVIEQSNVEISFILQYYTLLDRINHHFYLL